MVQKESIVLSSMDRHSYDLNRFDRGRIVVFIDGSNLFYAALQLRIEIDYVKLLHQLSMNGHLLHAFFYTGVDPTNDKQHGFLWWMRCNGYRVITKALLQLPDGSRKGNLDVEIAVDMMKLAAHCDTAVLVSGDGDFAYAVQSIGYQGARVEVVGLRSMTSDSLINAADAYIDLADIKGDIQKTSDFSSDRSLAVCHSAQWR
jgi:uncharacterized LabA/DUF88 family protein